MLGNKLLSQEHLKKARKAQMEYLSGIWTIDQSTGNDRGKRHFTEQMRAVGESRSTQKSTQQEAFEKLVFGWEGILITFISLVLVSLSHLVG